MKEIGAFCLIDSMFSLYAPPDDAVEVVAAILYSTLFTVKVEDGVNVVAPFVREPNPSAVRGDGAARCAGGEDSQV